MAPLDLPDNEILELVDRMQTGRSVEIDRHHLALGVAEARDVVVGGECRVDVRCRQSIGGEPLGIEPNAHGEILPAEDLHALQRRRTDCNCGCTTRVM